MPRPMQCQQPLKHSAFKNNVYNNLSIKYPVRGLGSKDIQDTIRAKPRRAYSSGQDLALDCYAQKHAGNDPTK